MPLDSTHLRSYPNTCGVYLMKDKHHAVLYVGKANNLKGRLKQYFDVTDSRMMIPFLMSQVENIDIILTSSEKEALLLENTLIKKHQPKYNALLKDDKTFVSLMINKDHPWPMLKLVRYKGPPKKEGLYFGPYTSSIAAKETLDLLSKIFPLRQCSDRELASRTRPCILHAMKRCLAPCVEKCTKKDYALFVDKTIQFLKGDNQIILKELKQEMELASQHLEFEKAAALLHTIKQIEHITHHSKSEVQPNTPDCDALGLYREGHRSLIALLSFRMGRLVSSDHFYFEAALEDSSTLLESFILQHYMHAADVPRDILLPLPLASKDTLSCVLQEQAHQFCSFKYPQHGIKKKLIELAERNAQALFYQEERGESNKETLLTELQEKLSLSRYPARIECFDTSHLAGTSPVASLVTFTHGVKDSARYRTYKIHGEQTDDYNALKEVLLRRYRKGKLEGDLPDLIIVDGGKGQLGVAQSILKELGVASCDLIALAKEDSRHDKGLSQEQVFLLSHKDPLLLPTHSSLLFFLQQIRDEAHRRAITLHQKTRKKLILSSELDALPGIGPVKKNKLLKHFGSVKKLKAASDSQLDKTPGLNKKDVEMLKKWIKRCQEKFFFVPELTS
jgi:excinuclease ABC subunit C